MDSEAFKAAGNDFFRKGEYENASKEYSKAIEASPDNVKLYTNRANAYLKLEQYEKSLKDGEKAIQLDSKWVKGHSAFANSLYHLGRFDEAKAAYQEGLQVDPTHVGMKGGLTMATSKVNSTPSPRAATSSARPTAIPSSSIKAFLLNDKFGSACFALRAFFFLNALMYILPLGGVSFQSYYRAMYSICILYAVQVYKVKGRPQFSKQYFSELVMMTPFHNLMLVGCLAGSYPSLLMLLVPAMVEICWFADFLQQIVLIVSPPLGSTLGTIAAKVVALATRDSSFVNKSRADQYASLHPRLVNFASVSEVLIGLMMIVWIFLPRRQFILLFIYWQMLRVRYMTSPQTKYGFRVVDQNITNLTSHRFCPAIISTVYQKIRSKLAGLGDIEAQQRAAQGNSGRPKCSIM
eukprot:TRINITY_DN31813_c0_g1_i1.p1 TRINITY_DN31813_c0_g1~~TRINITY_DN31813_c0_g1_i1.p1  ORF type:complete len:407 (+),score=97.72 TRINITY_DN31813_c0_g1_i1:49-1269(+)